MQKKPGSKEAELEDPGFLWMCILHPCTALHKSLSTPHPHTHTLSLVPAFIPPKHWHLERREHVPCLAFLVYFLFHWLNTENREKDGKYCKALIAKT